MENKKIYLHVIKFELNKDKKDITKEEFDILCENDEYLCLKDKEFTTIQFKKQKGINFYATLEKISVIDFTDMKFINSITIQIYSKQENFEKIKNKIAKDFDNWLYEKHGRFVDKYNILPEKIRN